MKITRWALLAGISLLAACASPTANTKTIQWDQPGDGTVRFLTNDKKSYNRTFYYYWSNDDPSATFSVVEATVKKVSGADTLGFGVMFCRQDGNFYTALITTGGYYSVWKYFDGSWSTVINPTQSENLTTGLGSSNVIEVTRDGSGNFTLFLNGIETDNFTDNDGLVADSFGPLIAIGNSLDENFPKVAEEMRASFTQPATLPSASVAFKKAPSESSFSGAPRPRR